MTKRPQRRDLKKFPLNPQEIEELKKILRSKELKHNRAKKVQAFFRKAFKHNIERGISPKKVHKDV